MKARSGAETCDCDGKEGYRMKPSVESLATREDTVRTADWLARLTRESSAAEAFQV